ncbi:MAG: hypothetical protein VX438_02325 [Planctomycetota bacterium]|nr:hypothetical protein [Planctomycetota bacterium]
MFFRKVGFFAIALCVCVLANDLLAQPGGRGRDSGRDGGRGGRGGFGGFGSAMGNMQTLGLLANKDVREKADITDDQYKDIQGVQQEMQDKIREAFQDRDFDAIRGIGEDAQAEIKDILLEKQWKTVEMISNQQRYIRGGQLRISEDFLVETLKMSKGDAEDAMEAYEELTKKFREKMAKLAQEMMDDFAKELPGDARKTFKELLGDEIVPIESRQSAWGRGRDSGRGGPGGQRGGERSRPKGDDF